MLELKNVSKFYYNKGIITTGFTKVNLDMKKGEFIGITGESGSGKSTLLNVISGLDSYEEGEMYVQGKETSHYTEKEFEEYRRKYIVNIFQSFNLINSYTVYQNVELVLLLNGYKRKEIKHKVLSMIEEVGMLEFKNTKVSKLSGGQKQKVAIARAMVKDTPIIVADEPTGNLDSESAKDVIEILKRVAKNKLVIIVTHNIEQIERYATRIIKMYDGRIIEDIQLRKIEKIENMPESVTYNITTFNKYRLGIRNTFNIFSKFVLLFFVFFFIVSAVFLEYASFGYREYISNNNILDSIGFVDLSEERIIIRKQDKTYFMGEDYEKIKNLSNVNYIVEEDLFLDRRISLKENKNSNFNVIRFSGTIKNINNFTGELDVGRIPENDNEIIIVGSRKYYYIENKLNEFLSSEYKIDNNSFMDIKLNVVGIKYDENDYNYEFEIYVTDGLLEELRADINKSYSTVKILLDNKYINTVNVLPSKKVEKGTSIVDNNLSFSAENSKIKNKYIELLVKNIYYDEKLKLKVNNTYVKSNFTKLTGYESYDDNRNAIFINEEEYNSLYDREPYQSSVYVINKEEIDSTMHELEKLGIKPKKASDYAVNNYELYTQYEKITKVIVTIIVVFVLFFISYFIIKIILKSRSIYYTTLRVLGAKYQSIKRILDIELFVNSSIAFACALGIIAFVKSDIIYIEYVSKIANFIGVKEYVLMYVILVIISKLISRTFSRKLFKKTVINTYNEEV